MSTERFIYHMCRAEEWRLARQEGVYLGSSQDLEDGFIHLSPGSRIEESARKHRAGQEDLVLLEVDAEMVGQGLVWEPSRGGEPFPHVYGPLPFAAVVAVHPLPLGEDGLHVFPPLR